MVLFSRRQLIDRDYNPLEDPEGPDRADLEPLKLLVRGTLILPDDTIQIVGWNEFRAFSIRDALKQLGEPSPLPSPRRGEGGVRGDPST